jgi:hypothetical protein
MNQFDRLPRFVCENLMLVARGRNRRSPKKRRPVFELDGRLERRDLPAPLFYAGTFVGHYNDVSQDDNGDTHDDSGTLALTITIVSRQDAEDVIGGSLTLTGYPEGTINLPLRNGPGITSRFYVG